MASGSPFDLVVLECIWLVHWSCKANLSINCHNLLWKVIDLNWLSGERVVCIRPKGELLTWFVLGHLDRMYGARALWSQRTLDFFVLNRLLPSGLCYMYLFVGKSTAIWKYWVWWHLDEIARRLVWILSLVFISLLIFGILFSAARCVSLSCSQSFLGGLCGHSPES